MGVELLPIDLLAPWTVIFDVPGYGEGDTLAFKLIRKGSENI